MEINEVVVVPILVAFVELAKGLGMPKKFSALAALAAGVIIGIFYLHNGNVKQGILNGIIYGLTSVGLYSGTKNTIQQMKKNDCGRKLWIFLQSKTIVLLWGFFYYRK